MKNKKNIMLITGLAVIVLLNLAIFGWLLSDLFAGKEEEPKGTVSATEGITTEEPTTEEPTTEAVVIEPGNQGGYRTILS